ncbi:hypothetical protein E3A20_27820, partial [Planctomyces bekefii]
SYAVVSFNVYVLCFFRRIWCYFGNSLKIVYKFTHIIIIDNINFYITTRTSGTQKKGLELNFLNYIYSLGDFDNINNGTNIIVDDLNQKIKFKNTAGSYNFSNMPAYTDNADAILNGLVVGDLYRHAGVLESQDQLRIVH